MDRTVPIVISESCLRLLHNRALNHDQEWGTTFTPTKQPDGRCYMSCSEQTLIEGTTGESSEEHTKLYGKPMMVAITPLHGEVITPGETCSKTDTITMFAHTHPKALLGWRLAVPSSGDLVAHMVLGNCTNWRRNQQINTALLVGAEGLYHYWILPAFLCKYLERIEVLSKEEGADAMRTLINTGEPTASVMRKLREEVLSQIIQGYKAFEKQMMEHRDALKRGSTKHINELATSNKLLDHLITFGMGYDFYPASEFKNGLKLEAAATVRP